jgi:hypothetical protein
MDLFCLHKFLMDRLYNCFGMFFLKEKNICFAD